MASFDSLPNELILIIWSYLDSVFVLGNLKKVCKRFESIISDEYIWKTRFPLEYPNVEMIHNVNSDIDFVADDIAWSSIIYEIEKDKQFLIECGKSSVNENDSPEGPEMIILRDMHIGVVHDLKLLNNNRLCVSASRDRTIVIWNVADPVPHAVKHMSSAHEGWVWSIASCSDDLMYTASWDSTVKSWSLEDHSNISTFKCETAVLSLSCQNTLIASGLFNSKMMVFDTRVETRSPIVDYTFEKKGCINGIALDGNSLYTASSTGCLNVYDLRKKHVVKSVEPFNRKVELMSFSYDDNGTIIVGTTRNDLAISTPCLETVSISTLELSDPRKRKISCIRQNQSNFICGVGNTLLSCLKSAPVHTVATLSTINNIEELTSVQYVHDNMLVYSSGIAGEVFMLRRKSESIFV